MALGDVVELEILPPVTALWLCGKDKFNLPMFSPYIIVGIKPEQKPNNELNAHCYYLPPPYCQTNCWQK